ncbi:MAG: PQQ-dependent sugar dehydrogenase [Deltaproteobacteria bacterium]|nr:PQQ-dependent sugar dehydrogenase [Deltaproteobacteria bacterium]
MRRVVISTCVLLLGLVVSCNFLLPERFAVNAPISSMLFGSTIEPPASDQISSRFRVPTGFGLSLYATGLGNVRWLRATATGDLLASRPRQGDVVLIARDEDGDGRSDGTLPLIAELNRPQGLELRDGWLYIAETNAIGRVRFDPEKRTVAGEFERIVEGFPGGGNHWSRTIGFGPDDLLYLSIGSSCNVCIEDDARRAAMHRYRPDGSGFEVVATGLRNSVGFDWQPGTDQLYATDNGRDLLGDDFPPGELNRIELGGFYGWPIANGNRVPDPDVGEGQTERILTSTPPAHPFRAHNAPLGISFIRGTRVPDALRGAALVALHGSWNRTEKDGYKVVSLSWQPDGSIREADFMTGFEQDDDVIGRPVHVVEGSDGAFYISDDYAGAIWRVAYGEQRAGNRDASIGALRAGLSRDPLADIPAETRVRLKAEGAALYQRHLCATCHDPAQAQPGVAVKRLDELVGRFDLDSLQALFSTPPPPMPILSLSAGEKRAISVYLFSKGHSASK